MAIMTHAKFHFNWLMLTLIFGIWASEPPRAWRTTEKAGPDRVKHDIAWVVVEGRNTDDLQYLLEIDDNSHLFACYLLSIFVDFTEVMDLWYGVPKAKKNKKIYPYLLFIWLFIFCIAYQ